jgi:hypothetical protein
MPAFGMSLTNQAGTCGKDDIILCPLDQTHFWEALRYTELNPLRDLCVRDLCVRFMRQIYASDGTGTFLVMFPERTSPV